MKISVKHGGRSIKIKGVSLIVWLIILMLSGAIVYADEISDESLSSLKVKEHLYYEDFDALKSENSIIYVIDKNSGETVYPQRIKKEDLLELEEKLSEKQITDFSKEAFPSYYEKYSIYDLVSKDGTEYLIFLENPEVTISFKSKNTPYLLYVEGEKIKVNTDTYDLTLPKGNIYKIKAEYDDSLKEFEIDVTNTEVNTLNYNINFGLSTKTKGIIISLVVIALIISLWVLYSKRSSSEIKDDRKPKDNTSSKPIVIKEPENIGLELGNPVDIMDGNSNNAIGKITEVILAPTVSDGENYETLIESDSNIYCTNPRKINALIKNIKINAEYLCNDLRVKKGEIRGMLNKTEMETDKNELSKLEEDIERILEMIDKCVGKEIISIECTFKDLNNFTDESKKDKIQDICYRLNDTCFDLTKYKIQADAKKERILSIRNLNNGITEKRSKYMEESFEEINKIIGSLANTVKTVEENSKQNFNSMTDYFKKSLSGILSNIGNELDFITERIDNDYMKNENNAEMLNNLILDFTNKKYYFDKKISDLENTIDNMNTNKVSLSQELKAELINVLKDEIVKNNLTLKSDELIEKLKPLTQVNQEYRTRFKYLDEESILFLSEGDMIKSLFENHESSDYSPAFGCYIKILERELKAIVDVQKHGLGEYIKYLQTHHINEWADFINEFESYRFRRYRNEGQHTETITKDVAENLRTFLLDKKVKGQREKGWLTFINSQKSKLEGQYEG